MPDTLPFDRVASFVRLLTHDFRNVLNGVDLQASLLRELVEDTEALEELGKMRQSVTASTAKLQQLAARFSSLNPQIIDVPIDMLLADLPTRIAKAFPDQAGLVVWPAESPAGSIDTDYEMLCAALREVFANAFQFRASDESVKVEASVASQQLRIAIVERKPALDTDPAAWGQPLVSSRRGGYGLGLFQAHRAIAALGGSIAARHADGALTTEILLPLEHAGA